MIQIRRLQSVQNLCICTAFFLKLLIYLFSLGKTLFELSTLSFIFLWKKNGFQTFLVSIQVIELDCLLWSKATVMSLVVISLFLARRCANWYFKYKCKLIFQVQAFLSFLFQDRWVSMLCWKMFTSVWYSDKVSTLLY